MKKPRLGQSGAQKEKAMSEVIKQGEKARIVTDGDVYVVWFKVMTASGLADVQRVRSTQEEALALFHEKEEARSYGTNGYELHGAADV